MKKFIYIIFLLHFASIAQIAFPTVKGFGENATGGRGGLVIHVTTLDETGLGSLVEAMSTAGTRTIVFDVGGEMVWTGEHVISEPNVSILFQTAPAPGITIKGGTLSVETSNVIIRFPRIRIGNTYENDCLRILNTTSSTTLQNVVIDHGSFSWANDEIISMSGDSQGASNAPVQNVTIQNSVIAENLDGNHYAMLLGQVSTNISLIQNFWKNYGNRGPEHTYGVDSSFEYVNNLQHNYNRAITTSWGTSTFESVGNVFKGMASSQPSQADHHHQYNSFENSGGLVTEGHYYQTDNIQIGSNSNGMMNNHWSAQNKSSRLLSSPYTPLSSSQVETLVLNDSGASVVFPDMVDARLFSEYQSDTGDRNITNISTVGGFPSISNTTHPGSYDTDNDAMEDAFETTYLGGLSATANGDNDGDGYTNIEEFSFHLAGDQVGQGNTPSATPATPNQILKSRRNF